MAKITTIINPLTGQPAQVDQLDHTAQEIDAAIARALPGGAIDITLQNKMGGIESTDYPGCYYRTVDGVVEWFNPPMILNKEYRTTERHLGRPVYVLTAEFGSNINGSIVYFGKDVLRIVRGIALSGDGDSVYPWWSGNTVNNWSAFFDFSYGVDPDDGVRKVKVICWAQTSASASYGHNIVKVYYTKSTD